MFNVVTVVKIILLVILFLKISTNVLLTISLRKHHINKSNLTQYFKHTL